MTSDLYQGKFNPESPKHYKVSRSKVELFIECSRCFYLDRRLAIKRPPSFPFNLNSAVDNLLKNEFDTYRESGAKHPIQEEHNIDAVPFKHKNLNVWRENFKGVSYLDPKTNLHLFGAVDDVWINSDRELIVVDYKATSKNQPVVVLNQHWQNGYKRQMEFYQWLLRKNEFAVSNTGYFVYCNGKRNEKVFNKRLDFDIKLIMHEGTDSWIESTLLKLKECLMLDTAPLPKESCAYCNYLKNGNDLVC